MKDLGASLITVVAWTVTVVALGCVARVAFELAAIGFTLGGLWPVR